METKLLNQYEITDKIGESVYSIIYKAFDPEKQIQVSVKLLKPNNSVKRDLLKIKSYVGIKNRNLCKVRSVEKYDDSILIVSDYIDGTPLQDILLDPDKKIENIIDLLLQINNGLTALHTHNLPHGNLKPTNIIIDQKGEAIVTDFGLSSFNDFQISPEFVAPYDAFHYLTPEQVKNEPITRQSDFFAMGIIAYRIIFGKLPFEGQNEDALVQSILTYNPNFSELSEDSHNSLISLLLSKLLAKEQNDRFVNTGELKATLEEMILYEKNSNSYPESEHSLGNPRKYLKYSVLAVMFIVLSFVLYILSK